MVFLFEYFPCVAFLDAHDSHVIWPVVLVCRVFFSSGYVLDAGMVRCTYIGARLIFRFHQPITFIS